MNLKQHIQQKKPGFSNLCQTHSVKVLYAFGSSVTDRFNEQTSDIDLLVEIDEPDPIERGEKLMSLWNKLEEFFDRKVDLLTESSLKNPILKKNIERTKVLLYDRRGQKSTCLIFQEQLILLRASQKRSTTSMNMMKI